MSHGGEEDDLAGDAWPGFVDILSSVMIMFVFFLMITATALFFHTIQFKSKMLSENEKVITNKVAEKVHDLIVENQILKEQIEQMKSTSSATPQPSANESKEKILQQSAEFVASQEQKTEAIDQDNTMVIYFGEDAISLTKETKDEIAKFLDKHKDKIADITLVSNVKQGGSIELTARKVAVARMLNVRNGILDAKIASDKIKAKVVISNDLVNGKSDWVKIVIGKK